MVLTIVIFLASLKVASSGWDGSLVVIFDHLILSHADDISGNFIYRLHSMVALNFNDLFIIRAGLGVLTAVLSEYCN